MAMSSGNSVIAIARGTMPKYSVGRLIPSEAAQMSTRDTKTGLSWQKQLKVSAIELMKLPYKQRLKILSLTAHDAEAVYKDNQELTDFEAFGEDDLYDTTP